MFFGNGVYFLRDSRNVNMFSHASPSRTWHIREEESKNIPFKTKQITDIIKESVQQREGKGG